MKDIHAIRPPVQVGLDPMFLKTVLLIVAGLLLVLVLVFLTRRLLKKKNKIKEMEAVPEPVAPFDEAVAGLDRLLEKTMADPRLFYFDLTAVLRRYIGRTFGFHAVEMTSQEFMKQVSRLELDSNVKRQISQLREQSDPVKYAGVVPDSEKGRQDLISVRNMIETIEKELKKNNDKAGEEN